MLEITDVNERNAALRAQLQDHVCEVTFTKVDGATRVMTCTLKESALPPKTVTETKIPKVHKPETLSVFDINKQEWRSFRVMNVTKVEVVD